MASPRGSETERPQPSVWRMLWVDFPSFISATLPLVVLGLGSALALFGNIPGILGRESLGPADLPYFLAFGGLVLVICLPLLILRIRYLRSLLGRGQETPGTILRAYQARNGSRLRFSYRFNGKAYARSLRTPTWQDELRTDSSITVIVDPQHPHQALIKELYFSTGEET